MSSGVTDCVVVMRVWNRVHFLNPHLKKLKIQIKNGSLLVDSSSTDAENVIGIILLLHSFLISFIVCRDAHNKFKYWILLHKQEYF